MTTIITQTDIETIINAVNTTLTLELDKLRKTACTRAQLVQTEINTGILQLPIVKQLVYNYEELLQKNSSKENNDELFQLKQELVEMKENILKLSNMFNNYINSNNDDAKDDAHIHLIIHEIDNTPNTTIEELNPYIHLEDPPLVPVKEEKIDIITMAEKASSMCKDLELSNSKEITQCEEEEEEDEEEEDEEEEEEEEDEEEEEEEEKEEEEDSKDNEVEIETENSEEEEEEEVFEIEFNNVTYYTNNETNGILYEIDKDGDPGKQIGLIKNGQPFFS